MTMNSSYPLQPIQAFGLSPSNYPTNSQETTKFSFFYRLRNDIQMYNINCEEMPPSLKNLSQLINDIYCVQSSNVYVFYHEQTESKKIYKLTCEMIPYTFMIQFLNKIIHSKEFHNHEQQ